MRPESPSLATCIPPGDTAGGVWEKSPGPGMENFA